VESVLGVAIRELKFDVYGGLGHDVGCLLHGVVGFRVSYASFRLDAGPARVLAGLCAPGRPQPARQWVLRV
jgi:hypothetical protein